MKSTMMWSLTPRRSAWAPMSSSWWRAPSTSMIQVRRWVGSRCSAYPSWREVLRHPTTLKKIQLLGVDPFADLRTPPRP